MNLNGISIKVEPEDVTDHEDLRSPAFVSYPATVNIEIKEERLGGGGGQEDSAPPVHQCPRCPQQLASLERLALNYRRILFVYSTLKTKFTMYTFNLL